MGKSSQEVSRGKGTHTVVGLADGRDRGESGLSRGPEGDDEGLWCGAVERRSSRKGW